MSAPALDVHAVTGAHPPRRVSVPRVLLLLLTVLVLLLVVRALTGGEVPALGAVVPRDERVVLQQQRPDALLALRQIPAPRANAQLEINPTTDLVRL